MINVLQVVGGLDAGGIETLFYNIYKNIDKEKIQFVFLCYGSDNFYYEDKLKKMGAKIVRLDPPTANIYKFIRQAKELMIEEKIDIVHSNTYYNSALIHIAARKAGVKVRITHSHSSSDNKQQTIKRKIYANICKKLISIYSTQLAACSQEAATSLFGAKSKYHTIINGFDIKHFSYNVQKRQEIRAKYGIPDNYVILGHVGRHVDAKNPLFLIDIFHEYHRSNPNSALMLIGKGELTERIKQKANSLKILEYIKFIKPTEDIYKYYSAFDYFVFPSKYEGLPLVTLEAQASGLPVLLSSNVPSAAKITALAKFLPLSTATKWAQCIITTPTNKNRKKVTIDKLYDINRITKNLEQWYSSLLGVK